MATIRAYTTIEQSKKLTEILPLESADMYYLAKPDDTNSNMVVSDICIPRRSENDGQAYGEFRAWSLAALLGVLPEGIRLLKLANISTIGDIKYHCDCPKANIDKWFENPVDACVAMIKKLYELNLL